MAPVAFATVARTQVALIAEVPSQADPHTPAEDPSQAALVLAVPTLVASALEAHTQVVHMVEALMVEALVVAEVTSEATDNEGYSSSVRTSAFVIF